MNEQSARITDETPIDVAHPSDPAPVDKEEFPGVVRSHEADEAGTWVVDTFPHPLGKDAEGNPYEPIRVRQLIAPTKAHIEAIAVELADDVAQGRAREGKGQ